MNKFDIGSFYHVFVLLLVQNLIKKATLKTHINQEKKTAKMFSSFFTTCITDIDKMDKLMLQLFYEFITRISR